MKLQALPVEDPKAGLTSLIDVVFLLLIFFMISTTFEQQTALQISLPKASAHAELVKDEVLEIAIDAEGRMYVNDNGLLNSRPATLTAAIENVAEGGRELAVILRADADTPHHFVVTAMDVLAKMGFSNLSIAASREPETN